MPLIACPDCQTHVSDAAPACPRCGRPIAAQWQQQRPVPVQPPPKTMLNDTGIANTAGRGCLLMILGAVVIVGVVKLVSCEQKPHEINGVPVTR